MIDLRVLEEICLFCEEITKPNNDVHNNLIEKLDNLQKNISDFYLYFLYILTNNEFENKNKIFSLIVLLRMHNFIENYDDFLNKSLPILKDLMFNNCIEIANLSSTIICSIIFQHSGKQAYNFDIHQFLSYLLSEIFNCLHNMTLFNNIQGSLIFLEEYSFYSKTLPLEIQNELLALFSNNLYCLKALSIFKNVFEESIDFIHDNVIPKILNCYGEFTYDSMKIASYIFSLIFIHYPEQIIGDFLVSLLMSCDNQFDDIIISTLFEKEEWIEPYPPIIRTLLHKLAIPDEDLSIYGNCSMSQSILQSVFEKDSEFMEGIILEFIQNKMQTSKKDVMAGGHILRCLSPIMLFSNSSHKFLQFVLDEMEVYNNRGDSLICLANYCTNQKNELNEKNDLLNHVINMILQLLCDPISNVQYQAIIAFQIINCLNFEPSTDHFCILIKIFKEFPNPDVIADITLNYLSHFVYYNSKNVSKITINENQYISSFFYDCVKYFEEQNFENNLFTPITNIITNFFKLLSINSEVDFITINLQEIYNIIFQKIFHVLSNDQDSDGVFSCIVLLKVLVEILLQQMPTDVIHNTVENLIFTIKSNQNPKIIYESFIVLGIFATFKHQELLSYLSLLFEICLNHFSTKHYDITETISNILQFYTSYMNINQVQIFIKKCCICLHFSNFKHAYNLALKLYQILQNQGQQIDDFITETLFS